MRLALSLTFLLCVAYAVVVRLLNTDIGFADGYNCDSWYFFGLQYNFASLYKSGIYYQVFRFPAVFPWNELSAFVSYETLNWSRYLAYCALTCAAFLWAGIRLFGERLGILLTFLFCCGTSFLGVLSHDYVTAAGLAWCALMVASIIEAGRSDWPAPWGVAVGFFAGLALNTHFATAMFVFATPLFFFATNNQPVTAGRVLRVTMGGLAGIALLTLLLGIYNHHLGGSLFYLGSQIKMALRLLSDAKYSTPNRVGGYSWLWNESNLPPMLLTGACCIVVLLRETVAGRLSLAQDRTFIVTSSILLITAVVLLSWEFSGRVILQVNVYGPWIYPVLYLAFGALIFTKVDWLEVLGTFQFWLLCAAVLVSLLLVASYRGADTTSVWFQTIRTIAALVILLGSIVAARRLAPAAIAGLIVFVVLNYPTGYGSYPWHVNSVPGHDLHRQAANADQLLASLHLVDHPIFWVQGSRFDTIVIPRTYLYCVNYPASFPSTSPPGNQSFETYFPPLTQAYLRTSRNLVIIAAGEGLAAMAQPVLQDLGFSSRSLGEWSIGSGSLQTTLAVVVINETH